ncbi:MAG TPA: hypothetical protein VMG99_03650 [Thermoplasmata archaeon]|jgi:hypothetical protein|nr:hypothetical protein [Thermoplasmata archaeon]
MPPGEDRNDPEIDGIESIVPARAVLTELARGFLLVHESNPEHAVRFAATFLREQAGRAPSPRIEPVQKVSLARLSLGRHYHGAIEPGGLRVGP